MSELIYDEPARSWLEALPLGNGALGAMCWGGTESMRFDINDETAWSGGPDSERMQGGPTPDEAARLVAEARALIAANRPVDAEAPVKSLQSHYAQAYLPIGTVTLRLPASSQSSYRRSLDLATAVHTVVTDSVVHTTVSSNPHGVLMHVIDGLPAGTVPEIDVTSQLHPLHASDGEMHLRLPSDASPAHERDTAAASWSGAKGASLEAAIVTRVVTEATTAGKERILVFIATGTTYRGIGCAPSGTAREVAAVAGDRIDAAIAEGSEAVMAAHKADHGRLFDRVSVTFGAQDSQTSTHARVLAAAQHPAGSLAADPSLAALLFDYGRYLLIASSRTGGLPATLQGIWNDQMQPPWSSNYTNNINLQMNYWGADVGNLPETADPLIEFVEALSRVGRGTAQRLYGSRGWVAHHNSDGWGFTAPVGGGQGDPSWAFWPMAGPWLVRHLQEREAFGGASILTGRGWSVLRGAAEFILDWMVQGPDGLWGTMPSTSPENIYLASDGRPASLSASTTMDLSLIRELFETVLLTATRVDKAYRLAGDDAFAAEVAERLKGMPRVPSIRASGGIQEWANDERARDPHHRHLSHLYSLYPGNTSFDAEHRFAAEQTLVERGDDSTGWSLCWKLALWARLRRADKVSALLRLALRPARPDARNGPGTYAGGVYPNLFAAHPPFQIDGNLGFVGALAEALLQSHAGEIELLPALPTELSTGSIAGLLARPGVIVDLEWESEILTVARLRARGASVSVTVRYRDRTLTRLVDAHKGVQLTPADFNESDVSP